IKNFVDLNNDTANECIFCVVDLHAITVKQDPKELRNNIQETVATFIASGIDPKKSIIFNQSKVPAHAEGAWILSCVARMGWLNRMTQFKEKAGIAFKNSKLGIPILVGKEEKIKEQIKNIGYSENFNIEIVNSKDEEKRNKYVKHLFQKLQREQGLLERDCDRLVRNDRVIWATSMVACGDADGAVTGNTRRFGASLDKIKQVVDVRDGEIMFGLNMVVHKGKTIFVGDTSVHEYPTSEQMAEMAISTARVVRLFGFDPKVAFVSHSTFGQPLTSRTKHIRNAVDILKVKKVDFEFDGDMQPDVALNPEYEELYPFSKIVGKANILIMPGQHSAAISYKMMKTLGDTKVIGPLLIGLGLPIEIAPLRSSTSELINLASIAAYSADVIDYKK
ncbi:phosphate acyltransferase, partial [Candidatus Pelagibacter sp.]|nr:phosphate acyltransferase [Candidatus Pelagibacter sp.]